MFARLILIFLLFSCSLVNAEGLQFSNSLLLLKQNVANQSHVNYTDHDYQAEYIGRVAYGDYSLIYYVSSELDRDMPSKTFHKFIGGYAINKNLSAVIQRQEFAWEETIYRAGVEVRF